MPERRAPKSVRVEMFKGGETPEVEIDDGDALWLEVPDPQDVARIAPVRADEFDENIGISLRRLRIDLHNQSFGMISASTGCISNPGGPSC
jgi:hypothetical protein